MKLILALIAALMFAGCEGEGIDNVVEYHEPHARPMDAGGDERPLVEGVGEVERGPNCQINAN